MNGALKCGLVLAACLALLSCAIQNEGLVDYRLTPHQLKENSIKLNPKYSLPEPGGVYITNEDTIAISLTHAFIKSFFEGPAIHRGELFTRGEIAIVAKAFEFGDDDFDFKPDAAKGGRLIYYTSDARKEQAGLNFSYLPIYGPTPYNGHAIGIQIYVIEMDTEDPAARNLLKEMAGLGKIAYPPASAILGVLDGLGGALLSGSHDDMQMVYTMTLHPQCDTAVPYPVLQAGNFVFVRKEERGVPFPWDTVELDQSTGRLLNATSRTEFLDETYLTVQIQRNFNPYRYDLSKARFGTFQEQLQALQKAKADKVTELFADIRSATTELAKTYGADVRSRKIMPLLDATRSKAVTKDVRREKINVVLTMLQEDLKKSCADPLASGCETVLSSERIESVLGQVRMLPGVGDDKSVLERLQSSSLKTNSELIALSQDIANLVQASLQQ